MTFNARLLLKACEEGDYTACVANILSGVDVNCRDSFQYTPLMYACEVGQDMNTVRFLLDHGADIEAMNMVCVTISYL